MRKILFRGKSKAVGSEWLYGDVLIYEKSAQIWETINGRKHNSVVSLETVGQYTGLTDKNGTKIFEGDIVYEYNAFGKKSAIPCVVMWEDIFARWSIAECKGMYGSKHIAFYEVIGNIHDNPELLKGE